MLAGAEGLPAFTPNFSIHLRPSGAQVRHVSCISVARNRFIGKAYRVPVFHAAGTRRVRVSAVLDPEAGPSAHQDGTHGDADKHDMRSPSDVYHSHSGEQKLDDDSHGSEASAEEDDFDYGGSGTGSTGGAGGRGEGDKGNNGWSSGDGSSLSPAPVLDRIRGAGSSFATATSSAVQAASGAASSVFSTVPAQVLVALIGMMSGVLGTRRKVASDKRAAESSKKAEARRRREAIEQERRAIYHEVHGPLLKAALKLSERLYVLVDDSKGAPQWREDGNPYPAALYSTYLLGRYLGLVEFIKRETQVLDLGLPVADKIFVNILGRVQGVLSAGDMTLGQLQMTERYFKPPVGAKPVHGGPLRVMPRSQVAIGELMMRPVPNGRIGASEITVSGTRVVKPEVLSFQEFTVKLKTDKEMRKWFQPVIREFEKLEKRGAKARRQGKRFERSRRQMRSKREDGRTLVGSRPYFLQCALLDLVDFLDPMPRTQYARPELRKRLRLGEIHSGEEQRMPPSLQNLYLSLADMRDRMENSIDVAARVRSLPDIEVYVKAAAVESTTWQNNEPGDCPYSQRVLIALEELGLPYRKVSIPIHAKPAWFHILHPEAGVPVMYHGGQVIDGSRHIMSYLLATFPEHAAKLKKSVTPLATGTMSLTRFFPHLKVALEGRRGALEKLDTELASLNALVDDVQRKSGGPFIGGDGFSREDTALAPMLDRADVVGTTLLDKDLLGEYAALRRYVDMARQRESFSQSQPRAKVTQEGFGKLKAGELVEGVWLPSLLE